MNAPTFNSATMKKKTYIHFKFTALTPQEMHLVDEFEEVYYMLWIVGDKQISIPRGDAPLLVEGMSLTWDQLTALRTVAALLESMEK